MKTLYAWPLTIGTMLAAVTLFAGCGEDGHEHENPNEEACEHITMGPFEDVTAAAMPTASAPAIAADHKSYRVALGGDAPARTGHVTFAAANAGGYIFFTSAPATISVFAAADMSQVQAESSAAMISECAEVKGRHVFDLNVGAHVMTISSSEPTVGVVVEPEAH